MGGGLDVTDLMSHLYLGPPHPHPHPTEGLKCHMGNAHVGGGKDVTLGTYSVYTYSVLSSYFSTY